MSAREEERVTRDKYAFSCEWKIVRHGAFISRRKNSARWRRGLHFLKGDQEEDEKEVEEEEKEERGRGERRRRRSKGKKKME